MAFGAARAQTGWRSVQSRQRAIGSRTHALLLMAQVLCFVDFLTWLMTIWLSFVLPMYALLFVVCVLVFLARVCEVE